MLSRNNQSTKRIILVVEKESREEFRNLSLRFSDCEVIRTSGVRESRTCYRSNKVDIAIISNIPRLSCLSLLNFFQAVKPPVPVIVVTQHGSEEFAVEAFRRGARDYFSSPFDMNELERRIYCLLFFEKRTFKRRSDFCNDNFRSAVQFIRDNYNRQIQLPGVAEKAGMSISCFERTFKKKMGETFITYINNLRIFMAKEMLQNHNLSICDIAYYSGFTNQYHFTRTFRKFVNMSPRQYRTSLRG